MVTALPFSRVRLRSSPPLCSAISSPAGCSGPINGVRGCSMEYVATAAFLLSVVAGSFAAVIFGGYGIAQLIASAL
jgi:hypothetical protein